MDMRQLPAMVKETIKHAKTPVIYEDACKALASCKDIDEAKYYSDKADALGAWAKIYKSDRAALESRRLKLFAFRRMGQLAEEIRPRYSRVSRHGFAPGPRALLVEKGLSPTNASLARRAASVPEPQFKKLLDAPTCHTPSSLTASMLKCSESWRIFSSAGSAPASWRSFCRRQDAKNLARGMTQDETIKARCIVLEIQEWLDEFERNLPKQKKDSK